MARPVRGEGDRQYGVRVSEVLALEVGDLLPRERWPHDPAAVISLSPMALSQLKEKARVAMLRDEEWLPE